MHDDLRCGRPSAVSEDLVRAVEVKIRESGRFTITSLSLHFPQISRSLLHEILSDTFFFYLFDLYTTRASPVGIPRDIYSILFIYLFIYLFFFLCDSTIVC